MKPPAFQFYARDWLSSTLGMPWDVAGVYIHLLAWSWDNGPLPNSPKWRRRIIGRNAIRLWNAIKKRWVKTKKGWINPRLEHQREQQASFAIRGEKGAKVRWEGDDISSQPSIKHMANRWPASASASSSAEDRTPAAPRPVRSLPFKIYCAVGTKVLQQTAELDLTPSDFAEELKRAFAREGLPYSATIIQKVMDAVSHPHTRRA